MEEKGRKRMSKRRDRGERECRRKFLLVIGRGRWSPTRSLTHDPKPLGSTIQPSAHWNKPRPNSKVQPSPPQRKPCILSQPEPASRVWPARQPRAWPDDPRLDPRPLHTRRPLVVPWGTSAARHPLGSSGFLAPAANSVRETFFWPVWHRIDPPRLDFDTV